MMKGHHFPNTSSLQGSHVDISLWVSKFSFPGVAQNVGFVHPEEGTGLTGLREPRLQPQVLFLHENKPALSCCVAGWFFSCNVYPILCITRCSVFLIYFQYTLPLSLLTKPWTVESQLTHSQLWKTPTPCLSIWKSPWLPPTRTSSTRPSTTKWQMPETG